MRRIHWIALAALALPALAVGSHCALIESGEVVVLETRDADGGTHRTRLWFVEHQGRRWVNAGGDEAAWLARIRVDPEVQISLPGEAGAHRAVPVPAAQGEILRLMRTKYGLADRWVRFMMGNEAVPVRLDPLGAGDDPGA